jgi:hypothetical protein
MTRALAILLVLLVGCGPASREKSGHAFTPQAPSGPARPHASVGQWRFYFSENTTGLEQAQAVLAAREHERSMGNLGVALVAWLGVYPSPAPVTVWVHKARTLGWPSAPEPVLGALKSGEVHVVLGDCAELPDLIHQTIHVLYAPRESHDYPALFWSDVLREQADSVKRVKLPRGCQ